MIGDYTWTGPIAEDSTITADQSTAIGQAIIAASQNPAPGYGTPIAPAPPVPSFWTANQAPIIAAAAAVLLLALASSMRD